MTVSKSEAGSDLAEEGAKAYEKWRDGLLTDPENRRIYEEESRQLELWLQLVEARQAAGLTQEQLAKRMGVSQAQVARIEKRGYDSHSLHTLRRYVSALGDDFTLEVCVSWRGDGSNGSRVRFG